MSWFTTEIGAPGTGLAFWCNDGVVTSTSPERLQARCRQWIGNWVPTDSARVAPNNTPVLMAVGELDPLTPASYARALEQSLTRARTMILPWWGHERPTDCVFRIAADFFSSPERALDTGCLAATPPIDFEGEAPSPLFFVMLFLAVAIPAFVVYRMVTAKLPSNVS